MRRFLSYLAAKLGTMEPRECQKFFIKKSSCPETGIGLGQNFISQKILESKKLDPKIILPLVSETANKLVQLRPIEAQTGPAIRKDMVTIKKHLHLLENSM